MLIFRFRVEDLANVRFAVSPLTEAMRSVNVLDDGGGHALHLPWIAQARERTRDLPLERLRALQPAKVYSPDFVNPPPERPHVTFEDELIAMAATPPSQIRKEIERAYRGRPVPGVLEPFISDPASAVSDLGDLLREYWNRTIAGHWPRIRRVLEGDVIYRAQQIAAAGAEGLFADVDPTVSWAQDQLRIDKPFDQTFDLNGRGLLFVPSVFVWPRVVAVADAHWQPTLIYPARGVGLLWGPEEVRAADAAVALLGRVRAAVLASLDQPRSTSDIAASVGVSAGGASQHLKVLREAGLVAGHRAGRYVLYMRTPLGDELLEGGTPPGHQ
jgi:DNA-binding transcriptional ArsR family regulator